MSSNPSRIRPSLPNRLLWFFIALLIIGAAIGGLILMVKLAPKPRQIQAEVPVPRVTTVPLEHRRAPLLIAGNGLVVPRAEVVVAAQVSGEVVRVNPSLVSGGRVGRDDVLIEIDPRPYRAALQEAVAARDALVSNLDYLDKQVTRLGRLREGNFATDDNLDDIISRRDQARANLARQDAMILNRELDLEHAVITAPFSGFVQSENVDVGDIVAPGMELGRLYASDAVEIVVSLSVDDATFIPGLWNTDAHEGRAAEVITDYGGHRYSWLGTVTRVEADLDRRTRTIDVVVTVENPGRPGTLVGESSLPVPVDPPPLLVGMYTDVTIEGMELPGHFLLPVSTVHDGSIWVTESEGRLSIRPVDVVRQEGNDLVLLAPDLPEGTPVIVSNIALVTDGMQVQTGGSQP